MRRKARTAQQIALKQDEVGQVPDSATVHTYLGRLTEQDRLAKAPADTPKPTADDSAMPPPSVDRLTYTVQIDGVDQYPLYAPVTAESTHHELVVFIDAQTRQEIFSTTFR
jgi:hypothetical protein